MASSSSTTSTRGGRSKSTMCRQMVRVGRRVPAKPLEDPYATPVGGLAGRRRSVAVEASTSEMATSTKPRPKPKARRKSPPPRARRSMLAGRPTLPTVALEPHHVDILALALIAVGVFLGGVSYLDWAGGALGDGAVRATRFVFGALGYAVPVALVIGGILILVRELRPPTRPLRTGLGCLVAALTLMLAAGTLGLGPGATPAGQFWHAAAFERRGGVVGQAEFWVMSHLLSTLGADILAVFLLVAGLILVSGATLATVVRATGAGVVGTGRAVRRSTDSVSATLGGRRPTPAAAAARSGARSPAR